MKNIKYPQQIFVILRVMKSSYMAKHKGILCYTKFCPDLISCLPVETIGFRINGIGKENSFSAKHCPGSQLRAGKKVICLLPQVFPQPFCKRTFQAMIHPGASGMCNGNGTPLLLCNGQIEGSGRGHVSMYHIVLSGMLSEKVLYSLLICKIIIEAKSRQGIHMTAQCFDLLIKVAFLPKVLRCHAGSNCLPIGFSIHVYQKVKLHLLSVYISI